MKIRRMNINDYEKVYQLWMSCSGMGLNNLDDSKEEIGRFLNGNPTTCLVAEEREMIIGVILAGNDGRRGYIYHTAVNPEYRRQGIASSLTNRLAKEIMKRGKVPFYCSAWSNIRSARNAIKSGFMPAWVEMTAKPNAVVDDLNQPGKKMP